MKIKETFVGIMGHTWTIVSRKKVEDERLEEIAGYTDPSRRLIVLLDADRDKWTPGDMHGDLQATIRHELIHAFLYKCGLWTDSIAHEHWAMNEEMIDWFALKLPEIEWAARSVNAMPGQKLDVVK